MWLDDDFKPTNRDFKWLERRFKLPDDHFMWLDEFLTLNNIDMLILDLPSFFRSKGIDKPVGWMMKQGITNNTAHKLLRGKFKRGLPMHHLNTICEKLWCTPDDLFVWQPKTSVEEQPSNHPLQKLRRPPPVENVNDLIRHLPPEKLEKAVKMLKEI